MYGMMYGMKKTTLYLPDDLKAEITCAAERAGMSEAELIRTCIRDGLRLLTPPQPTPGIFESDDPFMSQRVDELLEGFGEH